MQGRTTQADASFAVLGAALVATAFVFAWAGTPPLPPAPLVLLGVPSPLTGMTRSFVAVAHGDIARAFWFHPLGPLCFTASVVAALGGLMTMTRRHRPRAIGFFLHPWFAALAGVAFALTWVRQIVVFG